MQLHRRPRHADQGALLDAELIVQLRARRQQRQRHPKRVHQQLSVLPGLQQRHESRLRRRREELAKLQQIAFAQLGWNERDRSRAVPGWQRVAGQL
jgi:hypothetical protein